MKPKDKREWINTGIQFSILIVMIITAYFGLKEIQRINIELQEIKANKVISPMFVISNSTNTTNDFCIVSNNTGLYIGSCHLLVK
jgi:hypothetical protein